MKKIILILILTASQYGISQELNETEKLTSLCKIWGFLKYYHPNVADGSKNWDEQLFQILPKVEEAQTATEFSLVMGNWITSLGEVKGYKAAKPNSKVDYFTKNIDLQCFRYLNYI